MGNEEEEVDIISIAQKPEKKTLLRRYDIPIDHLSYEFISQCTDGIKLERIVLILRSGEEGIYPDLTKHAEKRLAEIKPTSAVLHTVEPVLRRNMLDTDERQEIDEDIGNWTCKMRSREKDLDEGKATLISDPSSQPEIRKPNVVKDKKTTINEKKRDKPKRIASCDYAAWDKYDVDTEINRIDLQDERRQAEMKRIQKLRKELDKRNKTARKTAVDKLSLTGTEVNVMAEQEREKGNEAFRAADYEEALRHYNASIEMDSNLSAYNNRAMAFIKLRRYRDALGDCNTVISRDHKNVKALLRRAVSWEHLERAHEALADYEAVLTLEPTNKTAISGANKLRRPCEREQKIRMKIAEENIIDGEDKAEQIKSKTTAETNNAACSKQRVSSNICYCDRAPGSSRSVATKPHLKASYCVEAESNKAAAAAADAVANKSKGRPTRDSSSGNKLSPVAKDFGGGHKTSTTRRDAGGDDVFAISRESLPKSRGASLEKSIFSCVSAPRKAKPSTVVIEELPPSDEVRDQPTTVNVRAVNKGETPKRLGDAKPEAKPEITKERETITVKSGADKNKKSMSPGKENKTKTNAISKKVYTTKENCQGENRTLETDIQKLENIESPYEFLRLWQSLKDDTDLRLHAKLLRCAAHEDMIIGNKLDGAMFSLILRCLEQQFCTPKDRQLLTDLLLSLSRVSRFSIVKMFMDSADKKAVENILGFLDEPSTPTLCLRYLKNAFAFQH